MHGQKVLALALAATVVGCASGTPEPVATRPTVSATTPIGWPIRTAPRFMSAAAMALPWAVTGKRSPEPTVVTVVADYHSASPKD